MYLKYIKGVYRLKNIYESIHVKVMSKPFITLFDIEDFSSTDLKMKCEIVRQSASPCFSKTARSFNRICSWAVFTFVISRTLKLCERATRPSYAATQACTDWLRKESLGIRTRSPRVSSIFIVTATYENPTKKKGTKT
jgi:hypothetical protein